MAATDDSPFLALAKHVMFGGASPDWRVELKRRGLDFRKGKSFADMNAAIARGLKQGRGNQHVTEGVAKFIRLHGLYGCKP